MMNSPRCSSSSKHRFRIFLVVAATVWCGLRNLNSLRSVSVSLSNNFVIGSQDLERRALANTPIAQTTTTDVDNYTRAAASIPQTNHKHNNQNSSSPSNHGGRIPTGSTDKDLLREQWLNLQRIESANRLELVHIPKTGGTVLEMAASRAGIAWSLCHHKPRHGRGSPVSTEDQPDCPQSDPYHMGPTGGGCGLTHRPPCFFPNATATTTTNRYYRTAKKKTRRRRTTPSSSRLRSFYEGAALFAVVRNPYDRIVSEYKYQQFRPFNRLRSLRRSQQPSLQHEVQQLNRFVQAHLSLAEAEWMEPRQHGQACNRYALPKSYFALNCHLIPQYDYIFGGVPFSTTNRNHISSSSSHTSRLVAHVILFQHLTEDFPKLMTLYGLHNITLPIHQARAQPLQMIRPRRMGALVDHGEEENVTITTAQMEAYELLNRSHLTAESRRLIQSVYRDDFLAFGYDMEEE